jgi:hypothetical protein
LFCRKAQTKRGKYCRLLVFETMSRWIIQDEASYVPPPSVYMVSKTKIGRRIVPICDTLAAWLAPYAGRQGMAWPGNSATITRAQRQTATVAGMKWKHNALRHSYASYRFAQIGDAGRVAGELGNSAVVVHRHYRELVTPSDAQAWFAVMPSVPGQPWGHRRASRPTQWHVTSAPHFSNQNLK